MDKIKSVIFYLVNFFQVANQVPGITKDLNLLKEIESRDFNYLENEILYMKGILEAIKSDEIINSNQRIERMEERMAKQFNERLTNLEKSHQKLMDKLNEITAIK